VGYIEEIQRLHGPFNALIIRKAQQDIMIDDIYIPKGTLISILHDLNHFNEKYYK
jgi:cytochrome P450